MKLIYNYIINETLLSKIKVMTAARAGLVIGHTGHFPGGADALKGPTEGFFFFFLRRTNHAGTASSQWPIGLSLHAWT